MKVLQYITIIVCLLSTIGHAQSRENDLRPDVDIIIDVGHGGVDGGTSHDAILEKNVNLQVGQRLYDALMAKGYRVVLNRMGDYALSDENTWLNNPSRHLRDLAQRKHLAFQLRPQMLISLHVNWSSSPLQKGPVVLYQRSNQSYFLALLVQEALNELTNSKEKPLKGKTYYVLKHSACPTIIVEMGFISNASDRRRLTRPGEQTKLVNTMVSAIDQYFVLVGGINAFIQREEKKEQ